MIGSVSVRFNQSISSHPLLGYYLKPPAVYLHGRKIPRVRNFHTRSWHFVCFICVSSVKGRLCGALSFLSVCSSKYSRVLICMEERYHVNGTFTLARGILSVSSVCLLSREGYVALYLFYLCVQANIPEFS